MTDDEKQQARDLRRACVERLSAVDVAAYGLSQIDPRLHDYVQGVAARPDGHNLYELLAAERFLRLLGRYEFRIEEVQRFIRFYEYLKFAGVKGRQSYVMTPIQVFQFASIRGFYRDATHRLVKEALLFVPRKYSKTTSVASLAVYDLLFGDANAQAFTAANTYDQAKICFDEIRKVLKGLDPKLEHFKLNRELISWRDNPERESFVRCLSSSADKLDGLNATTVIMDEYAQADSADLYNVLTTSMGARENPLTITITTASDKPNGPFAAMLDGARRVLRGELHDDGLFASIFQPDVDDEEGSPDTWRKVQPHMGITVKQSFYDDMWAKAQRTADDMKAFRTKLLNVFETATAQTWITGQEIRNHFRRLDIDQTGCPETIVAVDLSVDNDFSAVSYYVYLYDEKKAHMHTEYYFPQGRLARHPRGELYQRWASAGHLKLCQGDIIDYQQIVADILAHGACLNIRHIAFDPNKAQEFTNLLLAAGAQSYLYPYKQTNYYYTIPVQALPRMLSTGALTFSPNPINAYCFDNAVLDTDRMDNSRPMKRTSNGKIDGCVTACMAIGCSLKTKRAVQL